MKSTDQAARVRENQRKSRERKREYITFLENQIEQYKKEGAQHNLELQASARAVNEENRRLREENEALRLLLQQNGVPHPNIGTPSPSESQACCQPGSSCATRLNQVAISQPMQNVALPPQSSFDFTDFPEWSEFQPILSETIPVPSTSVDSLPSLCCSMAEPFFTSVSLPSTSAPMVPQAQTVTPCNQESSTPCRLAFRFLSNLNERRSVKVDLFEIALFGLWNGFKALKDSQEGCAVDNEMLFSVAARLLQE